MASPTPLARIIILHGPSPRSPIPQGFGTQLAISVWSALEKQHGFTNQKLRDLDPLSVNLQWDPAVKALGHLQQIYDPTTSGLGSEPEDLSDPDIRAAYRRAVKAFYVAYPFTNELEKRTNWDVSSHDRHLGAGGSKSFFSSLVIYGSRPAALFYAPIIPILLCVFLPSPLHPAGSA
ncbi:hypothetical protein Moror_16376 [Moniliophthora roreri MCA 2997]|uniref:Uncharacterized protein n=1 Tax=Moniliophthora roreri (strain MCA 2997) TaxID=1381753 RepID=V2WVT2_MONRO|nr:hypothetical protein Moror_16376 [Moniliophthora roreri MCA 2997]